LKETGSQLLTKGGPASKTPIAGTIRRDPSSILNKRKNEEGSDSFMSLEGGMSFEKQAALLQQAA